MKETETFLNDINDLNDDDHNPDEDDELAADMNDVEQVGTHHRLYSNSMSYDDEEAEGGVIGGGVGDGSGRGAGNRHHPHAFSSDPSSFSSYLDSTASSSHHALPNHHPSNHYSMLSEYSPHLFHHDPSSSKLIDQHPSMTIGGQPLPSYSSNGGVNSWSAANYLTNDTHHHLSHHNHPYNSSSNATRNNNNNSYFQTASGGTNSNNAGITTLLSSSAANSGMTENTVGVIDGNYLMALQSDHSNASYDTAMSSHDMQAHLNRPPSSFLQFLQNSRSLTLNPHRPMEEINHHHNNNTDILMDDEVDEDDDEEMRGDDNDPILALANRYSMIQPQTNHTLHSHQNHHRHSPVDDKTR